MGTNEVVITEATIIERVEAGRPLEKQAVAVGEILLWTFISVVWFGVIRFLVVSAFSLPWLMAPRDLGTAQSWLWLGSPAAVALAAFLTLQTNTRNRELHQVMTVIVLATALVFHINVGIANPFIDSSMLGIAWAMQAVSVLIGSAASLALLKRRRARRDRGRRALPATT